MLKKKILPNFPVLRIRDPVPFLPQDPE
jgi:hypothetical protein